MPKLTKSRSNLAAANTAMNASGANRYTTTAKSGTKRPARATGTVGQLANARRRVREGRKAAIAGRR